MIGKIKKGRSFYGLLRYLGKNPNASRLDSSVSGSPHEAAAQLAAVANAGRVLEKPVRHLMVRLPEEESLPEYEWRYVASVVLSRLGYEDAPFVAILHNDPQGSHVHVVTTARDGAGKYVSDSNDHRRIQIVLRELERELGLREPTPRNPRLPQAVGPFRHLEAALSGDRIAAAELIRHAAAEASHFEAFETALRELGFAVRTHWNREGLTIRGMSFSTPSGETFKASELDRALSRPPLWQEFTAIQQRRAELIPELPTVADEAAIVGRQVAEAAIDAVSFTDFVLRLEVHGVRVRVRWENDLETLRNLSFLTPSGQTYGALELDALARRLRPLWQTFPAITRRRTLASLQEAFGSQLGGSPRDPSPIAAEGCQRHPQAHDSHRLILGSPSVQGRRPEKMPTGDLEDERERQGQGIASRSAPQPLGEGQNEAPESRLAALLPEVLKRSVSYEDFSQRLEAAGWSSQIVIRGSAYGIRFEEKLPKQARGARPFRIAGSRLGQGFGLLALSRRFPHLFGSAVPRAARGWDHDPNANLAAFFVPADRRSRLKLDPRFLAFAGGTFLANSKHGPDLIDRYSVTPIPLPEEVRARPNLFGFAGSPAALRDLETYRLSRLRGLAHRVLTAHDPRSSETARLLDRLDRFAQAVSAQAPSLALQILVQLPACPTRAYRPAPWGAELPELVALTGPSAERRRLRETGLVVHSLDNNLWVERAHLPHLQHLLPALWVNDLAPTPDVPVPTPARSAASPMTVTPPRQLLPQQLRALERLAARDPSQIPAASLLHLRALREPQGPWVERSPAEALAQFGAGDRSSANLLDLASRPARLRRPRGTAELATYLRAERILTAELLRVARKLPPDLARAAKLSADLLALREAIQGHLRREMWLSQPPRPRRGQKAPARMDVAGLVGSIQSFALSSLGHLSRAASYWTALHAEDPDRAVARLAMTGLPPFRHAARLASAVRGDDPVLTIARLYLVDGAIRAAQVLAPKPLAAALTTARALVATLKTVFSLAEERGRGR